MTRSSHLLHNLILFGRVLRGLGLDASPEQMILLVQAFQHIEIGRGVDFYHAARTLLVRRREDLPLFDEAFRVFWGRTPKGPSSVRRRASAAPVRLGRPVVLSGPPPTLQPLRPPETRESHARSDRPRPDHATLTYSSQESLRHKDFGKLTGEELEAVKRMMARLVWRPGERPSRRKRPGQGELLDLRRTLRRSLRYGGEALEWVRREATFRPRPVVVVADVSGSMESYTRLLLHFLYSLAAGLAQPVETFLFSTRLTRITRELRGRDVEQALHQVSRRVPDWSGGTRLGEALKTFNFQWARRVLGRGCIVLLISDGWDRGDIGLLRREMARLQRSCYRLIWLNPLKGSSDYQPLARGMQTALPYVDDFLPVHNLVSLEDLAARMERLGTRRPVRRQHPAVDRLEREAESA